MDSASLIYLFRKADISRLPSVHSMASPLEKSLWILLVAKEANITKHLTAEEILLVIREVYEVSIEIKTVAAALNRAGSKVHRHSTGGLKVSFEIMKEGKDSLLHAGEEGLELFYFEPGKKFESKRLLSKNILDGLKGELRIVETYCGNGTLDILHGKDRNIQFLTKLDNLKPTDRSRLLREIAIFKAENPKVEFRDYSHLDLHDRYILSEDDLVLLGHGMSNLGGKESFAIVLNKTLSKNIFEAMVENFNRRWGQAIVI